MRVKPFTEAHAIQGVDIALLFDAELPIELREKLANRFSDSNPDLDRSSGASDDDEPAFVFSRKDTTGDAIEEFHIHADHAHLMWSDYRGWNLTRDDSMRRFQVLFDAASAGEIRLSAVGLAYRDVFFDEDPSSYLPAEMFRSETKYLAPTAVRSKNITRHWISWSENRNEDLNVRATLGVESKVINESEDPVQVIEIVHRETMFCSSSAFVSGSTAIAGELLDSAHADNKAMLLDLLVPELAARIGLTE